MGVAQARLAVAQAEITFCKITAPFDGVIADISARPFETIASGSSILTLINTSKLRIELILPANWVEDVAPGTPFEFTESFSGRVLAAEITTMAPRIDPVSQTIRAHGHFITEIGLPLAGTAGIATF